MTPQEKAKELVRKFSPFAHWDDGASNNDVNSELCALVAVDEILSLDDFSIEGREYWEEVKREIELA